MRFRVESLDQHYGSAQVLRQVGFEIMPGECLAVLGRNGAGKTTLLKCLMGVLPVSRGRVLIDETEISAWPSHRRSAAGLAYVPQGREIFSELTVGENIEAAALARALVTQPGLLILDEPTEGIQPNLVAAIKDVLAAFKGKISLLLVEQYLDFAVSLADAFVVLSRGTVAEAGRMESSSRDLLSRYIAI